MDITDKFSEKYNIVRKGDKPALPKTREPEKEYPGPSLGQRVFYSFYTLPEKIERIMSRVVHWYGGPGPEDM